MKMRMLMGMLVGALSLHVVAGEVAVTSVTAQQRDPRDGKVDVTVTMQGSAEDVANVVCSFAASNGVTKATIPVEHITRNGEDVASNGVVTRKFIWDARADVGVVKIDDIALTVALKPLVGVQLWENGPYWTECNVGAPNPEECGYYFWWGDTVGYKRNASDTGWISVKDGAGFSFSDGNCPTYGKDNSQLQAEGYIDAAGNLVAKYDAAAAHLGASWRMPTGAEFSALISNCTTTWTTRNGVYGRLVTGKGTYSSKSIFLPAAGRGYDSRLINLGSTGDYWSSTPYSDNSNHALFGGFSSSYFMRNSFGRFGGCSVRPVRGFASASGSVVISDNAVTTHFACNSLVLVYSVKAQQRYPWDGLVDITVTLQGAAEDVADVVCSFAASNGATKAEIPVAHITRNGEDSGSGNVWTRKFIWDAKADVGMAKIDDVALTVDAEIPLGGVQLWENGPYWAECNVGASQPKESGYYFWWGDTVGYKRNASNNGWVSVKDSTGFSFSSGNCPTYGKDNSQLQSAGYIDATGNLVAAHDAATAHFGAPWRMPTDADFSALIDNCTATWTMCNGVWGMIVTGKGTYSSKSIFLPAAGYGMDSGLYAYGGGGYGWYWSSTPSSNDSSNARILDFCTYFRRNGYDRYLGQPVRPVRGFASPSAATDGVTMHMSFDSHMSLDFSLAVTSVTAQQRYPWNGLVDITVTMQGMVEDLAECVCTFAATNSATEAEIPVAHITRNGEDTGSGNVWTRKVIWDAKADVGAVKIDDVALTVDLYLPYVQLWENGPYWAKCNVGATKPEEFGYYFWWGDTVGYERSAGNDGWLPGEGGTGFSFDAESCPTYGKNNSQLQSEGYIDATGNLVALHDAASAHLGALWRMPTVAEFLALSNNCTTTWTTRNGVAGRLVTGKGAYASKSIFLPAAGYGEYSRLMRLGLDGCYWSSTPRVYVHGSETFFNSAWGLYFKSGVGSFRGYDGGRPYGMPVRPIRVFAK